MRFQLLKKITAILFAILTLSLAYSQIVRGPYYSQLSQNNRIKLIRLAAPRGFIYDRKGEVLAGQRLMFSVAVLSQETKDIQKLIRKVGPILEIPEEELMRNLKRNFFASFIPVAIAQDVPKKKAIALESRETDIPGLVIQTEPLRNYLYGEEFCHILGYLGRISEEEFRRFKVYGLRMQDLTGRGGIEERYDQYLRGQTGGMQIEVNNRGYKVRVLGSKEPEKGKDIYLTVDARLQRYVYGLLEGRRGSCIVMNPQNGEILTMVSKPGFDPNLFIAAIAGKSAAKLKVRGVLNSEQALLVNRAISAGFPPGSIFKIIVASAGLESKKIAPGDTFFCAGSFNVGKRDFFCWNLDGHGQENIYSALAHSCNVFFYRLGLALGPDRLSLFARRFGLGEATGIDLPYESAGLVPSKSWKLLSYKERWYDGETANFSIGQGYLLSTPLQIAKAIAVIANGGYLIQPHIVKMIGEREIDILRKKTALKRKTMEIIKEGMRRAIQDTDGTGHSANISGIGWAGKTGTAQTSGGRAHGWFGGFYPLDKPQVLVLVFLEYGGSGAEAPARIAREIIKYIEANEI